MIDMFALHMSRLWLAGKSPVAPGTVGSFVAMLLAPVVFMPLGIGGRLCLLAFVFYLGGVVASRAEELLGSKDPGEVVIDELLGVWLTYLPFSMLSWEWLIVGFIAFRVFDILKPYPVKSAEDWLPAGWGIMIDDAVAGGYAMLTVWLLRIWV